MLKNQPAVAPGRVPSARALPAASIPVLPPAINTHPGAFAMGTMISFFLFSRASEFIDTTGNLHLVLIISFLGFFALFASGAFGQTLFSRPGIWLTLFSVWIVLGIPFSAWRGNSFRNFSNMWLKSFLMFFLIGGLIFTVEQFRKSIFWLGVATISVIYYAFRSGVNAVDERLSVSYGTLGNANDLAGALLMGTPFMLYVLSDSRRSSVVRLIAAVMTLVLLLVVIRTGSRGALIAIAAMMLLAFLRAGFANKAKILVVCAAAVLLFPLVASRTMIERYATMLKTTADPSVSADAASAIESTNARRELMKQGVRITVKHPIFGVGLGNFTDQSANLLIEKGQQPLWFTCHDIFLLVSSETGVPGLIFYVGCIAVCFLILARLQRDVKGLPELEQVSGMAFCVMVSLTSFVTCGIFSTSAYTFQLPLLAALTAALERVSRPAINAARAERFASQSPFLPTAPRITGKSRLAPSATALPF